MIELKSVVLGVLTVFLTIVVIVLAVKNRKLQRGTVDLGFHARDLLIFFYLKQGLWSVIFN